MGSSEKTHAERRISRICILVPKSSGEHAKKILTKSKLLDSGYRYKIRNETLVMPLLRSPDPTEFGQLTTAFGQVTIGEEEFEPRVGSPPTLEDVLSDSLPSHLLRDVPRSFDVVGDIAILQLTSDLIRYEKAIARGVMEVHRNVRAAFAKTGAVSGDGRLTPLRLLGGDGRTETLHKEFGCTFKVDVSKVFFSPRLSGEHHRVAGKVAEGESVVDMFTGVGPFSILIAKRLNKVDVDAIDSNEEAVSLTRQNARLNRVESKVRVWSGDAREIIPRHIAHTASRIIMNHPSAAVNFLGEACVALRYSGGIVHFYTFADGEDCESKARQVFERGLDSHHAEVDVFETRRVREVGPMRWQVAVDARVVPHP